jgi:hypothetical protein
MATLQRGVGVTGTDASRRKAALDRMYGPSSATSAAAAPPAAAPGMSSALGGNTGRASTLNVQPAAGSLYGAAGAQQPSNQHIPLVHAPAPPPTPVVDPQQAAREASQQQQRVSVGQQAAQQATTDEQTSAYDLAALQRQQNRETAAAEQKLAAGRATALDNASARSNLGGFGLAAGTSTLLGDVGSQQDNDAVMQLAALRQQQRGEQSTVTENMANLDDLERQTQVDYNQDHKIGFGKDADTEDNAAAQEDFNAHRTDSVDLQYGDKDTDPGTIEEPFVLTSADVAHANDIGLGLVETRREEKANNGGWYNLYTDKNGKVYAVAGTALPK